MLYYAVFLFVWKRLIKDCPIKKETNLEAYISVDFLQILTKSAPQLMQIFPDFQRDAL